MKKIYMSLVAGAVVALFANCGKNESASGGTPAMAAGCYYTQSTTNTAYSGFNNMQTAGTACNYNYSAVAGFSSRSNSFVSYGSTSASSCSYGQDAVYSPTKGSGCVTNTSLSLNGQPAIYDISPATASFNVVTSPNAGLLTYESQVNANPYLAQQQGYSSYGGSAMSAYSSLLTTQGTQVLRVCDGSEPCPSGETCRSPMGPQSPLTIGVCYF